MTDSLTWVAPADRIDIVAHRLVSIGDFSRMTHLTVKALRYYHDVGVLAPASIDADTGYRRYLTAQVPVAQVVKRLRGLDMPIDAIREVVSATDVASRNAAIAEHLARMEEHLAQTRSAVASLRSLLQPDRHGGGGIEFRTTAQTTALAITERVALADGSAFLLGALAELFAAAEELGLGDPGVPGALFTEDVFEKDAGELVAFVPFDRGGRSQQPSGRVEWMDVAAGEWAVMTHAGPLDDIDTTYGDLGTFVAERAIGVAGPIRENFVVSPLQTSDEPSWRTEVAWPIFRTGRDAASAPSDGR